MTGLEGVAAAAAAKATTEVVKVGSEAIKADRELRKAERLALLEEVKNSQGFKDAAAVRGKKLAVREQMGLALFAPLARMFRIRQDYFEADFATDFAERIADVPEENLQPPKPSVAGPAMEGLGYSLDEPELKQLYLELLARAADDRSADLAHPSFAEVIRQMTSEEAALLKRFRWTAGQQSPMVSLKLHKAGGTGSKTIATNVIDYRDLATGQILWDEKIPVYLDNWQRLGLVELVDGTYLTADGMYDWVEGRPEKAAVDRIAARQAEPHETEVDKGVVRVTNFGALFARAVGVAPHTP